jgi:chorismate mutase
MKKGYFFFFLTFLLPLATQGAIVRGNFYGSVPGNPYVNGTALQGYELIANRSCKDISCVQQNIKLIDSQIADLLARRLAFAKRAAMLKNSAVVSDSQQQNPNMITQVTRQAQAQGIPPEIAQSVFQEIDKQSQTYENKFKNLTPEPSPNSLGAPTVNVTNPVITPTITPGVGATVTVTPGSGPPGQR